ncbi:MAG: DUF6062 family protein [Lachnospiraceae bacterium]|nr:DUF6062 family protein [Lachnospiraceae bacterium]
MKEKLYTIPLNDAIDEGGECPLCNVERSLEMETLDFVLGSCASYMESDVRELTDNQGFCREHFKKMFEYGNTLGNGWILKTHYMKMRKDFARTANGFKPNKLSFADKLKGKKSSNAIVSYARAREENCYICNHIKEIYARYIDTFFILYAQDEAFREKVKKGKGFCLTHYADLCEAADEKLSGDNLQKFYDETIPLMTENFDRMQEDVNWLIEKFDYRNNDADWKNSKDAVQRGMQKLKGGFPADPAYKMKK